MRILLICVLAAALGACGTTTNTTPTATPQRDLYVEVRAASVMGIVVADVTAQSDKAECKDATTTVILTSSQSPLIPVDITVGIGKTTSTNLPGGGTIGVETINQPVSKKGVLQYCYEI